MIIGLPAGTADRLVDSRRFAPFQALDMKTSV